MPMLTKVTNKQKLVPLFDLLGSAMFLPNLLRRRSYRAQDLRAAKRILWMNVWALGDLVLTTPALASLRRLFPDAHITVLVNPQTRKVLDQCPWVNEILTATIPWSRRSGKYHPKLYLSSEFVGLLRDLRRRRFDLVIDGHMDIRNNLFLFLTGASRRLGFDYGGGGFCLTDLVKPDLTHPHHVDLLTQLVAHLGGRRVLDRPMLHVSEADRRAAQVFWTEHGLDGSDPVVGIHPGAGNPTRYWGLENFAAAADALAGRFPVKFLTFSQPDGYGWDMPLSVPHARVKPDLGLLMALLEKCDLFLCNDGGPMHVAAAVGTPVVAIFGPTEPKWWGPYGPHHTVVMLDGFACRPCGDRCKLRQPFCLTDMPVPRVVAALEQSLGGVLARNKMAAIS